MKTTNTEFGNGQLTQIIDKRLIIIDKKRDDLSAEIYICIMQAMFGIRKKGTLYTIFYKLKPFLL